MPTPCPICGRSTSSSGFTLVELVIVIALVGVLLGVIVGGLGYSNYWREEGFVRKLSETIEFLHHEAVVDQAYYRLEINFDKQGSIPHHSYHVGVLRPEEDSTTELSALCSSETGNLSCELASFISPSLGVSQTEIPPPDYPSLAEKVYPPDGVYFEDVRTMRGKKKGDESGSAFIIFSPRGFSEFAVLHLKMSSGAQMTILINPFSGTTKIYNDYRDFEWKYGRKESQMK